MKSTNGLPQLAATHDRKYLPDQIRRGAKQAFQAKTRKDRPKTSNLSAQASKPALFTAQNQCEGTPRNPINKLTHPKNPHKETR
ncbi:MAG: hypothetical protein PHD87_05510 [Candidatus Cloacimonetes bacterium]|nr:hypothetical protein [Candidatus Cloacimonadota bacterium]